MHGNKKLDNDPCPRGHTSGRTKNGSCRKCQRLYEQRRRKSPAWLRIAGVAWIASTYRALKRRSPKQNRATARQLLALWVAQDGKCGLTGMLIPSDVRPHLDHIVPTSKGGSGAIDNLHWTHPVANIAKNSHSVEEFRAWLLAAAASLHKKMELEELL